MKLRQRFSMALQGEGPREGHTPSATWLFAVQRGACFHCGGWMNPHPWDRVENPKGYTREHVLPLSRGGRSPGNVVLAHYACNSRRRDALPSPIDLLKRRMIYAGISIDIPLLTKARR